MFLGEDRIIPHLKYAPCFLSIYIGEVWLNVTLHIHRIVTDIPGTTDASFGMFFPWFLF
jgi:hypothetical protein